MRTVLPIFLISAFLIPACAHQQKPVRFDGPASLALEVLARELESLGVQTVDMDEPAGILKTRWEDTGFRYGFIDGGEATIFRRYVVLLSRRPADTGLTLRADLRICPMGSALGDGRRLPPRCKAADGIVDSHQQDLDRLGQELKPMLARLVPSPEAKGASSGKPAKPAMVLVVDLKPVDGLLRAGEARDMAAYLAAKLTETGRFQVTPMGELEDAARERQKASYKESQDPATQVELGRALSAKKMLSVKLIRAGDGCRWTATILDVSRVVTEGAVSADTRCGLDALPAGLDKLSRSLVDRVR